MWPILRKERKIVHYKYIIFNRSVATNVANSSRNEDKKTSEKDSLWCSYCKENRHTRKTWWKLHDKPLNFFRENGGKEAHSGYKSQANVVGNGGKQ